MIKLSDISTKYFLDDYENYGHQKNTKFRNEYYAVVSANNIRDYQQLKDFVEYNESLGSSSPYSQEFLYRLNEKVLYVEIACRMSEDNEKAKVFLTNNLLRNKGIDTTTADKNVDYKGLMTYSPASGQGFYTIKDYSVNDLRELLEHSNHLGLNYFADIIPGYDQAKINRLLQAFALYDDQMYRQYAENNHLMDKNDFENLFYLNKGQKFKLIKKQYPDIATKLLDMGGSVFGYQDEEALNLSMEKGTGEGLQIRNNMINHLANYCSLEEARNGIINTDAINRISSGRSK